MGIERDAEGRGEEMEQGQPVNVPAEASKPLSFCFPWVIGWAGWVAATAVVGTDKCFQNCYSIYFPEKHLEKWWHLYSNIRMFM